MGVAAGTEPELVEELAEVRRELENLQCALASRHQIGMAQGGLMVRYALTEQQAFAYLARRSQDENVKIRDLAGVVLREVTAPDSARPARPR